MTPLNTAPVSIETKWTKTYGRRAGDGEWCDEDECLYVLKWADGSTETVHSFRDEWNPILIETSKAKRDAALAKLDNTLANLAAESTGKRTERAA